MVTMGIDPGLAGALAWVAEDGEVIDVADVPLLDEGPRKKSIDAVALSRLIRRHEAHMAGARQAHGQQGGRLHLWAESWGTGSNHHGRGPAPSPRCADCVEEMGRARPWCAQGGKYRCSAEACAFCETFLESA